MLTIVSKYHVGIIKVQSNEVFRCEFIPCQFQILSQLRLALVVIVTFLVCRYCHQLDTVKKDVNVWPTVHAFVQKCIETFTDVVGAVYPSKHGEVFRFDGFDPEVLEVLHNLIISNGTGSSNDLVHRKVLNIHSHSANFGVHPTFSCVFLRLFDYFRLICFSDGLAVMECASRCFNSWPYCFCRFPHRPLVIRHKNLWLSKALVFNVSKDCLVEIGGP